MIPYGSRLLRAAAELPAGHQAHQQRLGRTIGDHIIISEHVAGLHSDTNITGTYKNLNDRAQPLAQV